MSSRIGTALVVICSFAVLAVMIPGCASVGVDDDERPGDPQLLEQEARSFHSNLRWARYEHAADSVHESYRATFEGEYEERGEDFEIVDIGMKSADMEEGGRVAVVEVEQQWFELPSTVVETERFVERWVFEDETWLMRERLRRDEYRERGEEFDSERAAAQQQDDSE